MFQYLSDTVDKLTKETKDTKQVISGLESEIMMLKSTTKKTEAELNRKIKDIQEAQLNAERYSRSYNLRFGGIPEDREENPMAKVKHLISNRLSIPDVNIEIAHRIGRQNGTSPRQIIAKFLYRPQRQSVLQTAKKELRNVSMFVTEDLPTSDYQRKTKLRSVMNAAYQEGKKPRFRNGELYIDGKLYIAPN